MTMRVTGAFSTGRRPGLTVTGSSGLSVSSSSSYEFLLPDSLSVLEGVHWSAPAAHFPLMGPLGIVQVGNVTPIVLNPKKSVIRGIRGTPMCAHP